MPPQHSDTRDLALPIYYKDFEITADIIRDTPVPTQDDILRAHGRLPPKQIPLTKYIHVSPGTIRDNYTAEQEGRVNDIKPAIVVAVADKEILAYHVEILGPCRLIQRQQGLPNGARVWIETEAEVDIFITSNHTA